MMKWDVVREGFEGKRPAYVPWSYWFTGEATEKSNIPAKCTPIKRRK